MEYFEEKFVNFQIFMLPLALPASEPACGEGAIVFTRSLFLLFFTGCGKPSQGLKQNGEINKELAQLGGD